MKRYLIVFLAGVLVTLFLFGLTPLLPGFRIISSAQLIDSLTALGTISATLVALVLGIWGEQLKNWTSQSSLEISTSLPYKNLQKNSDGVTQGQTRLKVSNIGFTVAENAILYINKVYENGKLKKDFFPVALSWTHHNGSYFRNFGPKETWYVDLARKNDITNNNNPVLVLAGNAGAGVLTYENIEEGVTTLETRLSQKTGKYKDYTMMIYWKKGDSLVDVVDITEVAH